MSAAWAQLPAEPDGSKYSVIGCGARHRRRCGTPDGSRRMCSRKARARTRNHHRLRCAMALRSTSRCWSANASAAIPARDWVHAPGGRLSGWPICLPCGRRGPGAEASVQISIQKSETGLVDGHEGIAEGGWGRGGEGRGGTASPPFVIRPGCAGAVGGDMRPQQNAMGPKHGISHNPVWGVRHFARANGRGGGARVTTAASDGQQPGHTARRTLGQRAGASWLLAGSGRCHKHKHSKSMLRASCGTWKAVLGLASAARIIC